jgi:predicted amidohydrolase
MKALYLLAAFAGVAGAQVPLAESSFAAKPAGWTVWAARPEISPTGAVSTRYSRGGAGALELRGGGNPASSGGWERTVPGVTPGVWYRLTAYYRAEGLRNEANEIVMRLGWTDSSGANAGRPEFAWRTESDGAWRKLTVAAPAPEKAAGAKIQLWLHNAPDAAVWWDDIRLEQVAAPTQRKVSIASIHHRPRKSSGPEQNVREFLAVADKTAPKGVDLFVFPEGMTVVGNGRKYPDVAEPVPDGPTVKALGEYARAKNAYIAAGIYERDGRAVYNTAVLIDRKGRLAGKYRKVYLPREEIEAGLTAGNSYPVFETDFGKVGLMICWDVQYADPARALAVNGAEIVLLPIWGGNLTLMRARAIENHVFLVSSGYDVPTMVVDPKGETLASTDTNGTAALATIDLNRRYEWEWLGEMRGRFHRELRLDVPVTRPEPAR